MCKQQSCVGNADNTTGIAVFFVLYNMYFTTNHTCKAWNITDTDGNDNIDQSLSQYCHQNNG